MADQRPGVGQPRMTVAEEPEYQYGTRKRKNVAPTRAMGLLEDLEDDAAGRERAYHLPRQRRGTWHDRGRGRARHAQAAGAWQTLPEAYGRPLGSGKFTMDHYDFICQ